MPRYTSEVKGAWFVSANRYMLQERGEAGLDRLLQALPAEHKDALSAPMPSEWYPEEALQALLHGLHAVCNENDRLFLRVVEGCTGLAINRLFSTLLRLSSTGFVLRRVPTMWKQVRRGGGMVEVSTEGEVTTLRYSDFPPFEDRLYPLMTQGSLRGLVRVCTNHSPRFRVLEHTNDSLHLALVHDATTSLRPPAMPRH